MTPATTGTSNTTNKSATADETRRTTTKAAVDGTGAGGAITHLGPDGKVPEELHDLLTPATLSLAGANVIMQLAQLPVGRAVAESTVDSGNLYQHPIKRARTTIGYVMIAVFGTDEERVALAAAVTEVHRQVRSLPGAAVRYNALDPALQLWVAACIYRGVEDGYALLHGPPPPELLDLIYRHGARLATMLQVPAAMWPPDRAGFEEYWCEAESHIEMDEVTRRYLYDFASLGFLPWPVPKVFGWYHRAITAGFLPAAFRRELGLAWGPPEQRAFALNRLFLRIANTLTPRPLRSLPFDLYLWDMRLRLRNDRNVL
jgi:uncharacterized protein (DUF2236 family)